MHQFVSEAYTGVVTRSYAEFKERDKEMVQSDLEPTKHNELIKTHGGKTMDYHE